MGTPKTRATRALAAARLHRNERLDNPPFRIGSVTRIQEVCALPAHGVFSLVTQYLPHQNGTKRQEEP